MKSSVIIFLIVFIGCSTYPPKDKAKIIPCDHSVTFGDVKICLPEIDGMTECYAIQKAKSYIDKFVDKGSEQLALYLNQSTFKQIEKLDKITFDDYISVIGIKALSSAKITPDAFNTLANSMEGMYQKDLWDNVKKKIEKNYDFVTIGKPIIIDSYSSNDNIRTFIILSKYIINGNEQVSLMTMNLILIKEKVIILTYYKDYTGEASVNSAKSKNDYIALLLADENK